MHLMLIYCILGAARISPIKGERQIYLSITDEVDMKLMIYIQLLMS